MLNLLYHCEKKALSLRDLNFPVADLQSQQRQRNCERKLRWKTETKLKDHPAEIASLSVLSARFFRVN